MEIILKRILKIYMIERKSSKKYKSKIDKLFNKRKKTFGIKIISLKSYANIKESIIKVRNSFKRKSITGRIYNMYYLLFFLLLILNNSALSQKKDIIKRRNSPQDVIISFHSEITIKINGTGNKEIIHNPYICPNITYINETKVGENQCLVLLENPLTIIRMVWFENLTDCNEMFSGLSNITEIDLSKFYSSFVVNTSLMFYECHSLKSLDLSNFNTSLVVNMGYMFYGCHSLKSLDLSNFNTSLVVNMEYMFYGCSLLQALDLSNFNTSLVQYMDLMFDSCSSLQLLNLSNFNTSLVISMVAMFYDCKSLKSLDVSSFNTSLVRDMMYMFRGCSLLQSLDLSNFNTSLVDFMYGMFYYSKSLKSLDLSMFNTSLVISMSLMFDSCSSLQSLDLSNFNTSLVISMGSMFFGCSSLKSLNLSNFNTSSVKGMGLMFYGCHSLKSLDLSNFNTSLVEYMNRMFDSCSSLQSLDLSNFNTSLVTSMESMFNFCYSLKSLDLSKFNTSLVTNMGTMFFACSLLQSLDLSNFNTSLVVDMRSMFHSCYLLQSLELYNFNTSLVRDMGSMFFNCRSLQSLNLSNFNTSLVVDMGYMFFNCSLLQSLDLSSFNTSLVINMESMFYGCISLRSLELSKFNTSLVEDMSYMFYECILLKFLNLSHFNSQSVTRMDFMFYDCKNLEYINLKNEIGYISLDSYKSIFFGVRENIVYCINKNNSKNISLILENIKCSTYSCSDDWKEKQKNIYLINGIYECKEQIELSSEESDLINIEYTTIINDTNNFTNNSNIINDVNNFTNNSNIINDANNFANNSDIINDANDLTNNSNIINDANNITNNSNDEYITIINETNNFTNNSNIINNKNNFTNNPNITSDANSFTNDSNHENTTIINDINNFTNNSNNENTNNLIDISIDYNEGDNLRKKCIIEIENTTEELTYSILEKNLKDYNNILKSINKSFVNHIINKNLNFTITIFKDWICTNLLLEYGFFEINPSTIYYKINNSTYIYDKNNYIFVYTNHNYKNYIEIYDIYEEKNVINNRSFCPGCLEGNNLKIINNLTQEMNSELGKVITSKIIEDNIDPFNKNNPIFDNICKNFTIEEIDIPIRERKEMIYLGNKEKEMVCNDINCDIESFFISNLTGVCNCQISNHFNNLLLNEYMPTNSITQKEYQNFINSKTFINSFLIFKCGKDAFFLNNLKINGGFYISISFLIIQFILFIFFITNKRKINAVNSNPPKIQRFEIDEDLEEEEIDNNKNIAEKSKIQNIHDSQDKNNQNDDNNIIVYTNSVESITNNNLRNYKINNEKKDENVEGFDLFAQKEKELKNKKKLNEIQLTRNRRSIKNISKIHKTSTTKESFIESTVNQNKEEITKQEYEANKEVIIKSSFFWEYYWEFLSLKQPIINLFAPLKCLKIIDPNIPTLVKIMKIIFFLSLNIFFNVFHLEQKYFRKKYEYFNNKYNIRYEFLNKKISLNERLSYAFKNAIISGLISFLISFIIQSIINYFFFNHKKILIKYNTELMRNYINNINNKQLNINESIDNIKNKNLRQSEGKKYILFFGFGFIIMIIIFYPIITFNEIYRGGFTDLLAATIWTFILLQIIPFILCLVFALLKYIGTKKNNDKLYQFIYLFLNI